MIFSRFNKFLLIFWLVLLLSSLLLEIFVLYEISVLLVVVKGFCDWVDSFCTDLLFLIFLFAVCCFLLALGYGFFYIPGYPIKTVTAFWGVKVTTSTLIRFIENVFQ